MHATPTHQKQVRTFGLSLWFRFLISTTHEGQGMNAGINDAHNLCNGFQSCATLQTLMSKHSLEVGICPSRMGRPLALKHCMFEEWHSTELDLIATIDPVWNRKTTVRFGPYTLWQKLCGHVWKYGVLENIWHRSPRTSWEELPFSTLKVSTSAASRSLALAAYTNL
jgi:hypothetical protein